MSNISIQSKRRDGFTNVTRITVIPKNKYSQLYKEHQAAADKGIKPPQSFHNPKSEMVTEHVDQSK